MIVDGDSITCILKVKTNPKNVVFIQALFEIHENIAVVKTVDLENSVLALITTTDYKELCLNILESVKDQINFELI